ncbi:pentatricopeptide repeat-containing protein At1g77360, mitochondrial-like [Phoenix dactylifera]|uniref:Pentatricopeptide repeat-containing protein At1g77360, mitochondrial-like n=1 Tax=Phoenix dactylifera TaxID=42345 RepID=A0A8B8ZSS9_PHODC|nr:pentatricopeptide repeat-containing protein At1g77360, mitochondrial-like [Phoenix dactylifera]
MIAAKSAEIPRNTSSAAAASAKAMLPPVDTPPAEDIVDSRVHTFCAILSRVSLGEVEAVLTASGIAPLPELVEAVLRRSYSNAGAAIKFFRWSGLSLRHSSYAWNLMVDILGKNGLFDAMWDAIRSMKQEGALSLATFASAFSAYCSAGRIKEAVMTFDVMDRYAVPPDIVAVNSVISAICRQDGRTADAADFLDRVKSRIAPDADSFAILLEGWEKEGNVARAKSTFGEMVVRVGWNTGNMSAYDAFLATLVRGAQAEEAVKFLKVMKAKNCLPSLKFFANALDILIKQNNHASALALWDIMVGDSGLVPNLSMYNAMIALLANNGDINSAYRLLDDMPFLGVFPDSLTYNTIFESLIRNKMAHEAERFLAEMRKNEQLPSLTNCAAAIKMFFDKYDPSAAIEVWNCMVEECTQLDEECADELLVGLRDLGRLSEVRRHAEDMIDRGIVLRSSTMEGLKSAFYKAGKEDAYDRISRRMKQQ